MTKTYTTMQQVGSGNGVSKYNPYKMETLGIYPLNGSPIKVVLEREGMEKPSTYIQKILVSFPTHTGYLVKVCSGPANDGSIPVLKTVDGKIKLTEGQLQEVPVNIATLVIT